MPRESREKRARRTAEIVRWLKKQYPDSRCWLHYRNPFELFVATVLSAQCTDARVNLVTEDLFQKYRGPADYASAPPGALESDIRSTGFYNSKAKSLRRAAELVLKEFGGELPDTEEGLLKLPGVGRKTANVILGNAFGKPAGMVVDTHIGRITRRLGLTKQTDPVKAEGELNALIPAKDRAMLAHRLIEHGRKVCTARRARCEICCLAEVCPKIGLKL